MEINHSFGTPLEIQQTASEQFNGSHVGRASASHGGLTLTATRWGTTLNGYTFKTLVNGYMELRDDNDVIVFRGRSEFQTWDDAADIINRESIDTFTKWFRAHVNTPGAMTTTTSTFANGTDPDDFHSQIKFPSQSTAGLFYFDQRTPLIIEHIEGNFVGLAGPTDLTVQLVNLDRGLRPIGDEFANLFTTSIDVAPADNFSMTDFKTPLVSFQAVRVIINAAGKVRVKVRKVSQQSML